MDFASVANSADRVAFNFAFDTSESAVLAERKTWLLLKRSEGRCQGRPKGGCAGRLISPGSPGKAFRRAFGTEGCGALDQLPNLVTEIRAPQEERIARPKPLRQWQQRPDAFRSAAG